MTSLRRAIWADRRRAVFPYRCTVIIGLGKDSTLWEKQWRWRSRVLWRGERTVRMHRWGV